MSKANRTNEPNAKPKRKRGRKLLIALGLLLVLIVVGVLALPTIAGAVAPGIIAGRAGESIAGRVEVDSVSLSWTGTQRVRGARLYDADNVLVAELDASAGAGLLGLATGSRNLGEIELSGVIKADRTDAGEPRFMNAIASTSAPAKGRNAPQGSGKPASVPSSLAARLNITQLRVEDGGDVLATLTGTASLAPGAPIKANLKPTFSGGGSGVLDATVTSLIGSDGVIDVGGASVALTLDLNDVPASLVQAFNPSDTDLPAILGDTFSLDAGANGTLETMDASTSIASAGVNGGVALNIRDGVLTRTGESQIRVSGERAARAIPALRAALSESGSIAFETWPEATLVVSQLRASMDAVRAGTYEGVLLELRVVSTPARARVPLSGDDSRTGVLDVSQMTLFAASENLSTGVNIASAASATLDGRDAGDIVVQNLRTGPLFDASGALRDPMTIGITGEVLVTGLAAETVQPFLEASGVSVAGEIGPIINASLRASSEAGSEAIRLALTMDGAKVEAASRVIIEGSSVRGDPEAPGGQALSVNLTDPSATLTRVLGESGVRVDRASAISLVVQTLSVDLGAFSGETPDLRGVRAQGVLRAGSISASLTREGEVTPISITGLQVSLDAPQSLANVTGKGELQLASGSNPPAAVTADLRASDLLGGAGEIDIWGATVAASVKAPSIPAGAINAFLPAETLDAAQDLGPSVSVDASVSKGPGRETPASIDLSVGSDRVSLTGKLIADERRVRTRDGGVTLTLSELSGLIERHAPLPEGFAVRPQAAGVFRVTSLELPLSEGRPSIEGATFDASARVTQLGVFSSEGTRPRANAKPIELSLARASGADVSFKFATEGVVLKGMPLGGDGSGGALREAPPSELAFAVQGSAPWAGLVGDGGGDVTFTLSGSLTDEAGQPLAGLSGGGKVRAPGLDRVDVNATAQLTSSQRTQEALALGDLLTGLFGKDARLSASLASESFDTASPVKGSRIGLEIESPRMKTSAPVRLVGDSTSLRLERASALTWRVAPEWANARLAGQGEAPFRLSRPVDLKLDLQRLVLPQDESARLDVQVGATSSDVSLTMADGSEIQYQGLVATASSTQTPGVLAINATMKNKGGGVDAISAELTVEGLGSKDQQPAASGLIALKSLPSSVADAIVGGNGKLAMLLGETADVRVRLENFPRNGGAARGSINGVNATASFDGRVESGTFVVTRPAVLNVNRVDSEFGFELAKVVPIFGGITKQAGVHAPGRVEISPLRIPVDGRDILQHASATINIDPGEANLQLDGGLGRFLKLGGQGQTIGQRLQPFDVRYEKGVANYNNLTVPVGEFKLVSKGSVNLAEQTQNVRVSLPVGALAAEFAGGTGVLGQVLDATGGVSLASVGKIGESGWELKLGGGGGSGNAPDPGKLLEGILGGRKKDGG